MRQTRCRRQPTWADRSPGRGGGGGALCCLEGFPPPTAPASPGPRISHGALEEATAAAESTRGEAGMRPRKPPGLRPRGRAPPHPPAGRTERDARPGGRRGTPHPPPAGGAGKGCPPFHLAHSTPPPTRTAFPRWEGAAKAGGLAGSGERHHRLGLRHLERRPGALQEHQRRSQARRRARRPNGASPPRRGPHERHGRKGPKRSGSAASGDLGPASAVRRGGGAVEVGPGSAPLPYPRAACRRAGGRGEGPAGQSEKSGPIRQECPSLVWRGLGPARENVTSPHRSGHRERPPGRRRDEDGDRRSLAPALAAPAFLGGKRGRREPRERGTPATRGKRGLATVTTTRALPVRQGREQGDARGAARRDPRPSLPLRASLPPLTAPAATLGCCRPEGSAAVPPGRLGCTRAGTRHSPT